MRHAVLALSLLIPAAAIAQPAPAPQVSPETEALGGLLDQAHAREVATAVRNERLMRDANGKIQAANTRASSAEKRLAEMTDAHQAAESEKAAPPAPPAP